MRELPTGTVTLLFTDIEGSTRLLRELGDRYAEALVEHRRVLRQACARHGGVEVDTQGDSFFFAFAAAKSAAAAASEAQATLAGGPVRVRMGIHSGEPVLADEGYVGLDVHHAARVMGAAHGGQVLVSEATRQLLDESVPLRDLGEHRLKDLTAARRLYQLGNGDHPPPRTLRLTNLPIQTPLVGRVRELREAGELLRAHRLLTLTGPGGSGKTRLALQLAAEVSEEFSDGVFWVALQALRDPALVEHSIGVALGADGDLGEHVGSRRVLVLLDNFEQVIEAAPAVASLVSATPNARIVVTSREPLLVEGEQRYPVEPMPEEDAAVLFVERARGVRPGFEATPAVVEICRRLDGLPLALELAAARVALLEPDDLLARLRERLPLLASGSRDAPARQRTLRATIEWSYELLSPDEQQLFRRLAAFRGSFEVDAAETICDAGLDTLESLVVKSLVRRWSTGRLGMLDTIREYARGLLDASEESDKVRRRHAEYFLELAKSANLNAGLPKPGPQRLDLAILEQDNIRGAIAWCIRSGTAGLGLELATAMEQFWVTDDPRDGMRWFQRLFDRPESEYVDAEIRGHALRSFGGASHIAGHPELAEPLWEESLACFEELGDEHGRAVLLHRLGISAMVLRGDLVRARGLVEESDALHSSHGDLWGRAQTVGTLGAIERDTGDPERALELVRQSAEMAGEAGVVWWRAGMLAEAAALQLGRGRVAEAEASAREALEISDSLRDRSGRVFGVALLAWAAAERGDCELAGRLWGAVEDEDAHAPTGGWRRHRGSCLPRIATAHGEAFDRGQAEGRDLPLEDAVAAALGRPAPG